MPKPSASRRIYAFCVIAAIAVVQSRSLPFPRPDHGPRRPSLAGQECSHRSKERGGSYAVCGGNSDGQLTAGDQLPGKSNYYRGNDPKNRHANVSQYARVSYKNVYPGINLAYYGEQSKPEFDLIVAPESNPAPIDLAFNGAQHVATDASGNLVVSSAAGNVMLRTGGLPATERHSSTRRGALRPESQQSSHFRAGQLRPQPQLVIDPTVMYATYLGGSSEDDGLAIAFDSSGMLT